MEGDYMTISAIEDAIKSFKHLYIDSKEVEIIFIDKLTETIEIRYISTDIVTFVTRSSLSEQKKEVITVVIDDLLIFRYSEVKDVYN
jgi:hypothetical protein